MTTTQFRNPAESAHVEFVALFPAAGHARRLSAASGAGRGSKELAPVPDLAGDGHMAVGDYLVREYQRAGIRDIVIVRRAEKTDIQQHYPDSPETVLNFHHVITEPTPSTAHSINVAHELYRGRPVALGFPDIILHSRRPQATGVFSMLCNALSSGDSDICLGLFPATNPTQSDMVACTGKLVNRIDIKPARTSLDMTWSCAVWQPRFSDFLHQHIADHDTMPDDSGEELFLGRIFQAAMRAGMHITAVSFPEVLSLDIGTPDALARARALRSSG